MEIKFDKKMIKKIAREYIFTNTSYRKLGEKYKCSSSKISDMMNYDLLEYSRILYVLAELKANYNRNRNMKNFMKK